MKLSKALIAGATAVALSFAGTSVASAQETADSSSISDIAYYLGSSDDPDEVSPATIREWISTFTSIINAMDTLLSFSKR